MSSSMAGPAPSRTGGEVGDHGHVLVATAGVAPHVLVDPRDGDAVEPGRIPDQRPPAFGQDRVVGGVPGDPEPSATRATVRCWTTMSSSTHRSPARDNFAGGLSRQAGVLTPHMTALGAPVAAHCDFQRARPPAQRLVRQPADHHVPRCSLAATPPAPLVGYDNHAREHRPVRIEVSAQPRPGRGHQVE